MTQNPMGKHRQFIFDELLPAVLNHSGRVGCTPDEAALASFLALGTALLKSGLHADSLFDAVRASAVLIHDAPEGLQ